MAENSADSGDGSPSPDPRPPQLRPEAMASAEEVKLKPRVRDQALPEKEDDRFFDRWMFDFARLLGKRAAKKEAVERLIAGGEEFAEWRAEGKEINAEEGNAKDLTLVASAESRIERAEQEMERFASSEEEERARACELEDETDAVVEERSRLRPALRGSKRDAGLVTLAALVITGVDVFVIQLALTQTVGLPWEHEYTAYFMGAGAAVLAAGLGWLIAAAALEEGGRFRRISTPFALLIAQLGALAVWFFFELGDFRAEALGELLGLEGGKGADGTDPVFFTAAQVVFFAAAVLVCFSYFARSTGRSLMKRAEKLEKLSESHNEKADRYKAELERAHREAVSTPVEREEAIARIYSRTKVANAAAARDRRQGSYLAQLVWAVYHRFRAELEIGTRVWSRERAERLSFSAWRVEVQVAVGLVVTAAAGGAMYLVVHKPAAAIITALIVATVIAARLNAGDGDGEAGEGEQPEPEYVAEFDGPDDDPDGGRVSTDITGLTPRGGGGVNGNGSGNGHLPESLGQIELEGKDDLD